MSVTHYTFYKSCVPDVPSGLPFNDDSCGIFLPSSSSLPSISFLKFTKRDVLVLDVLKHSLLSNKIVLLYSFNNFVREGGVISYSSKEVRSSVAVPCHSPLSLTKDITL